MRKYVTRIIPLVCLLISALMGVIADYSWQMAACALVMVAVPVIVVFCNKDVTLMEHYLVIAGAWLLIKLLLPVFPFDLERWLTALLKLFNFTAFHAQSVYATPVLVLLLILQLTAGKSKNAWAVLIRYILLYIVLKQWTAALFWDKTIYSNMILCVVVAFMMREMLVLNNSNIHRSMLPCVAVIVFVMYLHALQGAWIAEEIARYFQLTEDTWQRNQLLIFGLAILFWVDGMTSYAEGNPNGAVEKRQAEGMLVWGILYLMMHCWTEMMNYEVLYLWFPVAYLAMQYFFRSIKIPMAVLWTIALAVLLTIAKSFNLQYYCGLVLMLFILVAALFWEKQERIGEDRFALIIGISSLLLLVSLSLGEFGTLSLEPKQILVLIIACAIWWIITGHVKKMISMESESFPDEFAVLRKMELPVALVPACLAMLSILFVL